MDNEDVGKPVSDYFGVTGDDPQVNMFLISCPNFVLLIGDITISSTVVDMSAIVFLSFDAYSCYMT